MNRTRRGFFAALLGTVPAVVAVSTTSPAATSERPIPYDRDVLHCPTCGQQLLIVTRFFEKSTPHDAVTWSCLRCELSWRVPVRRLEYVTAVPYDDGHRPEAKYCNCPRQACWDNRRWNG